MAKQQFDTFLPSGALEQSRLPYLRHYSDSVVSPKGLIPRVGPSGSIPHFIGNTQMPGSNYISPLTSPALNQHSPSSGSHPNQYGHIISPPISRSSSSDGKTAGLVQDWRVFTRKLREQFLSEKAHMEADRVRSEEVMAEERALWDKERAGYERRIAELEAQLETFTGPLSQRSNRSHAAGPASYFPPVPTRPSGPNPALSTNTSKNPSLDSNSSAKLVLQESGRNADGSRFYAPVSQHPSRTFESMTTSSLRVDSMPALRETPLRVTSKELKQTDFLRAPGQFPSMESTSDSEGSVVGDSIDISLIEPGLDGVSIKSSAISPTFAARVMSPSGTTMTPSKFSPDTVAPRRPTHIIDSVSSPETPKKTLDIIKQPEGRRLTMHAGHTPNHSVISFELGDSGLTTPKASAIKQELEGKIVDNPVVHVEDEDPELSGPLGLTNDSPEDEIFLATLTSKLEEVAEHAINERSDSIAESDVGDSEILRMALNAIGRGSKPEVNEESQDSTLEGGADGIPVLKLKPSTNFGRPLGTL